MIMMMVMKLVVKHWLVLVLLVLTVLKVKQTCPISWVCCCCCCCEIFTTDTGAQQQQQQHYCCDQGAGLNPT